MFISRMWFDEVERIGKQRCTPAGYALHGAGQLVGFIALLLLLVAIVYVPYRAVIGEFNRMLLWLLLAPFVIGFFGKGILAVSWLLAHRKQFHYDHERRVSRWIEHGVERTYTYADWEEEHDRKP